MESMVFKRFVDSNAAVAWDLRDLISTGPALPSSKEWRMFRLADYPEWKLRSEPELISFAAMRNF